MRFTIKVTMSVILQPMPKLLSILIGRKSRPKNVNESVMPETKIVSPAVPMVMTTASTEAENVCLFASALLFGVDVESFNR